MAIAGPEGAVAEPDEIAISRAAPGELDDAVARGIDRRPPRRGDVDALVHSREAEQRVAAHAEAGRNSPRSGHRHRAGAAAAAQPVEPFGAAVALPWQQLQAGAAVVDAGIKQVAELDFTGYRTRLRNDQVEAAIGAEVRYGNAAGQRLDERFDRLGRRAGGACRAIETGADRALDTQRGMIDRDRDLAQRQCIALARDLELEVEARAERKLFERAGLILAVAAAERQVERRARLNRSQRDGASDEGADLCRIGVTDS